MAALCRANPLRRLVKSPRFLFREAQKMQKIIRRLSPILSALFLLAGCASGGDVGKYAGQAPSGGWCRNGEECRYGHIHFRFIRYNDGEVRIVGEMEEYEHPSGGADVIVSGTLVIGCFRAADRDIAAVYRIHIPSRRVSGGLVAAVGFARTFADSPSFDRCAMLDYINAPV
jgi:hypothetical protein